MTLEAAEPKNMLSALLLTDKNLIPHFMQKKSKCQAHSGLALPFQAVLESLHPASTFLVLGLWTYPSTLALFLYF